MNGEVRPLNVPLVLFTLIFVIVSGTMHRLIEPRHFAPLEALAISVLTLLFAPIGIIWTRAVWNTLMPRITGWKEISFWEAAGLTALLALLY